MSSVPSWHDFRFALHDAGGSPVTDVLAVPVHAANAASAPVRFSNATHAHFVHRLCTLPPTKLAQRTPPNLIEQYDGCLPEPSSQQPWGSRELQLLCPDHASPTGSQGARDPRCVWWALVNETPTDPLGLGYCLPLDDPILADRGVVPVPVSLNETSASSILSILAQSGLRNENRVISVLKHVLESRNHSAANLPMFSNVTVRPLHKRLRLGICVAYPPIGAPCSPSAVDDQTGSVADGWIFPSSANGDRGRLRLSLARPQAAFSPLVGPPINTLDHIGTSLLPFPFFTVDTNAKYVNSVWSIPVLSIPSVKCATINSSTTNGVFKPLVITGPCSSNRDCLSGVCSQGMDTKMCNNGNQTDSPFSPSFVINTPPRFLTYPPNAPLRHLIDALGSTSMGYDYLPEEWVYYIPVMIVSGMATGIVLVALIWMNGHALVERVQRRVAGWRTTTQRDFELKPVSGRMVDNVGDERAVQESVEAVQELPMYVEQQDD